jgi:hypothetical protein
MASRLHKAINHQRHLAFCDAFKKYREHIKNRNDEYNSEIEPTNGRNLPYPKKLFSSGKTITFTSIRPTIVSVGITGRYPVSMEVPSVEAPWEMMAQHCLWVRVFDNQDELLFNHANSQEMNVSQMISSCTKLVNHLNLISQTDELKVQKALGTLEGTITAQLASPLNAKAPYPSWEVQNSDNDNLCYDIGAIAIINQNKDNMFEGQLIDDFICGTTFKLP